MLEIVKPAIGNKASPHQDQLMHGPSAWQTCWLETIETLRPWNGSF